MNLGKMAAARFRFCSRVIFPRQWGTTKSDWGYSIDIDDNGDIYVPGNSNGDLEVIHTGGMNLILTMIQHRKSDS